MEEKISRVEYYKKKREEIQHMDDYSFKVPKKTEGTISLTSDKKPKPRHEKPKDGISKGTLTLSLDEMIKNQEKAIDKTEKKEAKKNLVQEKKKHTANLKPLWIALGCLSLFAVVLTVILINLLK